MKWTIPWARLSLIAAGCFICGAGFGFLHNDTDLLMNFNPIQVSTDTVIKNNFTVILFILVSGILTLGAMSSLVMFLNGAIIGETVIKIWMAKGAAPLLTGLLPHFLLEMAALIVSAALTYIPAAYLCSKKIRVARVTSLTAEIGLALILIIVSCALAGLIEGQVSKI